MTLDDVLRRFALLGDTEPTRTVQGTALALAQYWLVTIPAGKSRDQAVERLHEATELACAAITAG